MEKPWRWTLGMLYVVTVALIWITASFVVQSVVGSGVSPFLVAYICNSLFVIYLPIVEVGALLRTWLLRRSEGSSVSVSVKETARLLEVSQNGASSNPNANPNPNADSNPSPNRSPDSVVVEPEDENLEETPRKARVWTRREVARVSLLICPFWFLAQFTFNLSLKYTSVTSNTILSSASSLFTFLLSLAVLNEKFKWTKLASVLLCMIGTITVTLADTTDTGGSSKRAWWGDVLCLFSALVYALYSTLIRKRLPDEDAGEGKASTALFFGYLGLFNALFLGPVALILHFSGLETFHRLTLSQFGLIVGKGLLDNVLSDYLWAKAVLLTTPTAATAGLNIQIPIAALVDSFRGKVPTPLSVVGAVAVLVGFFGINQPATGCCGSPDEEDLDDFDNVKQRADGVTV